MKIDNKTHWRTEHLRAFCTRIAQDELDTHKRKQLTIHFEFGRETRYYSRKFIEERRKKGLPVRPRTCSSGCAYIGGCHMWVRLPFETVDKVDMCHTIAHEMAHIRGMKHPVMRTARYARMGNYREIYGWAEDYPLDQKPEEKVFKPTPDTKLAHAQTMLEKANTRLRRAKTIHKKWSTKVKYYERRLAATKTES